MTPRSFARAYNSLELEYRHTALQGTKNAVYLIRPCDSISRRCCCGSINRSQLLTPEVLGIRKAKETMKGIIHSLFIGLALLAGVHDVSAQGSRFFRIVGPAATSIISFGSMARWCGATL